MTYTPGGAIYRHHKVISAPWSLQIGVIPYSLLPRKEKKEGLSCQYLYLRWVVPTHDFMQTAKAEKSGNFSFLFNQKC